METIPSMDWIHNINNRNNHNNMGNLSSAKLKMPKLKISPENEMSKEDTEDMMKNLGKPIIEMEEKKIMPLYMFIGTLEFMTQIGGSIMNFMASVMHNKKEKCLEIRGRMRYEDTGRKTVFNFPETFQINELPKAKEKIKDMYQTMLKQMPIIQKEPIFELEFRINESSDSIIQKMNDSNKFNIGISKIK